ncbi:sugar transporter STL1 [Xylariales sp. PMI_506]|nr:sugar transporter STL1 [Xylariales sp. PMI_506]
MTFLTGRPLNWAITAAAGAGFLLFGYDQGVMSGLLTGAAFTKTFPQIDLTEGGGGSASLQGTVVAIYEIGCFFGAIWALLFGERLGRRKCIMIGCLVLSIGGALQASASTIPHLIVGRIVAGLGNGVNTSTIPVWHSELMRAHDRGKGLCIELAINIFGVMTAYWVDYGMSFVQDSEAQFRFPLALQCAFALVTFAAVIFLPESPRWLVAHDRHEDARQVLWAVDRDARSIAADDDRVTRYLVEIQEAIQEEREAAQGSGSFRALLKNGEQKFFLRTMLGIGGQFMQQLSGINLITYYAPSIFQQSVGMTHDLSLLLAGFNGVAYFLSSLVPIWIIDRLGRRKLMLFAAAGQGACMAILAGTVSNGSKSAGIVAIVMLFLFNFFFAVGLLAIPWLLPAEYAPLAIRTRAAALATASNWIFTFLVVEITPVSITNIGWRTYVYFCVFNFAFLPLIYFFYPETRNLSLEQIDKLFTGDKVKLHWHASMGDISNDGSSSHEAGGAGKEMAGEAEIAEYAHN